MVFSRIRTAVSQFWSSPYCKGSTTKGKATTGTAALSNNGVGRRLIVIRFCKLIYTKTWLSWKNSQSSLFDDLLSQTLIMNLTGYPNAGPLIRNPTKSMHWDHLRQNKIWTINKITVCPLFIGTSMLKGRPRWLCGLRFGSAAARLLGSRVRIPQGALKFFSSVCCILCR